MRDVAVAALHVVNGAANGITRGERNLELSVDVVLDLLEHVLVHLVALAVNELDAVVREGVVACGDHDATVKATVDDLIRNARRGDDVEHVGIGAAGNQACYQRRLEHVARATGVLADKHASFGAATGTVVPAHKAPDLIGVVNIKALVGPAPKAVGSEVLHFSLLVSGYRFCAVRMILPVACGRTVGSGSLNSRRVRTPPGLLVL